MGKIVKFSELKPMSCFTYNNKHWLKLKHPRKFVNGNIINAILFNPDNPWWRWDFFDRLLGEMYVSYFEPGTEVKLIHIFG